MHQEFIERCEKSSHESLDRRKFLKNLALDFWSMLMMDWVDTGQFFT